MADADPLKEFMQEVWTHTIPPTRNRSSRSSPRPAQIKVVEQQDAQWTRSVVNVKGGPPSFPPAHRWRRSATQIHRLLKPGSKYLNLNPYEVLQMSPDATEEQLRKQYKRLSILVHPDKNRDNGEDARRAFESRCL